MQEKRMYHPFQWREKGSQTLSDKERLGHFRALENENIKPDEKETYPTENRIRFFFVTGGDTSCTTDCFELLEAQ
jgi:hypothetical protein